MGYLKCLALNPLFLIGLVDSVLFEVVIRVTPTDEYPLWINILWAIVIVLATLLFI